MIHETVSPVSTPAAHGLSENRRTLAITPAVVAPPIAEAIIYSNDHTERNNNHEATTASNNWLSTQLKKLPGNVLLTIGSEIMMTAAAVAMPAAYGIFLATRAITPLLLSTIPAWIGAAIGWQGAKHGKPVEQISYAAIKAVDAFSGFFLQPWRMIIRDFSIASTLLGNYNRT